MKLPKCEHCGYELYVDESPCLDQECCGIPHSITCSSCYTFNDIERYDLDDLLEEWINLGGDEEGFKVSIV